MNDDYFHHFGSFGVFNSQNETLFFKLMVNVLRLFETLLNISKKLGKVVSLKLKMSFFVQVDGIPNGSG